MPEPPEPDQAPSSGDDAPPKGGWIRPSQYRPKGSMPPRPEPTPRPGRPEPGEPSRRPDGRRPDVGGRRRRPELPTDHGPNDLVDEAPPGAVDESPTVAIDDDATEHAIEGDDPTTIDAPPPGPGSRRRGRRDGGDDGGAGPRRRAAASGGGRRRALAGVCALILLVGAVVGIVALSGSGGGASRASKHLRLGPLTTPTTAGHAPALIATTKGGPLLVYDQPNGKVVQTLSAKTDYNVPRTVLAIGSQPDWLQVLLPLKPNDTQGWVKGADVTTTTTDYSLRISLSRHHLWLVKAGAPVVDTAVVIGKKETPTPTGLFYVTDPVDLQTQPNGPYGAFALGLSGYSTTLPSFDGGPPQIAVHGTPFPDQVGQDISNGCVRIPSPIIVQIAKAVPLGTPVNIVA